MIEIVDNRYGKQRVRLMKVTRGPQGNAVYEWTVAVLLRGDFGAAHTEGDNSNLVATDTMKNTVYWVARESNATEPEIYAGELIDYLLTRNPQVDSAEIAVDAHLWRHAPADGTDGGPAHPDTFLRGSNEVRTARVERHRSGDAIVRTGLRGMHLLKTAHSAFAGFQRDALTSLPETEDRVFGTVLDAEWLYAGAADLAAAPYASLHAEARATLIRSFADHHSASVQHTLYAMAEELFAHVPQIDELHLTMPNKHCLLVDLARFGGTNPNEIFVPTDEPHGLIEAHLRRSA